MKRIGTWGRERPSRVLTLPSSGRAIVVSDLHGNSADWEAFLKRSSALERIAAGEDLWLILTGDVPDVARHRLVDPRVPLDGDVQILDSLLAARAALGPRAERIVYVEGNHDFHVARVAAEGAAFVAQRSGSPAPNPERHPTLAPEDYERFTQSYRRSYGEAVFANNIAPYDMAPRARREHLQFVTGGPVLVVMPGAGVAVAHAGPARPHSRSPAALQAEIASANPADLREANAPEYFGSAYHQLLNNRFRHGDYTLEDLSAFLSLYGCAVLVTGHTPHPYLLDLETGSPLPQCSFRDGLGLIGDRQIVLCTSFGAFLPRYKRYLEFSLASRYADASALASDPGAVCALYSSAEAEALALECRPLPGAEFFA